MIFQEKKKWSKGTNYGILENQLEFLIARLCIPKINQLIKILCGFLYVLNMTVF
jgi:hypothetical protein